MHYLVLPLSLLCLSAATCQGVPPLQGPIYMGHSATKELLNPSEVISCGDPEFDRMVCFKDEGFAAEIRLRYQCREWKTGTELIDIKEEEFERIVEELGHSSDEDTP